MSEFDSAKLTNDAQETTDQEVARRQAEGELSHQRAEWLQEETRRIEAETASLVFNHDLESGITAAFRDIGVVPYNLSAAITLLKHAPGIAIRPGVDGPEVEIDGQAATLLDACQRFAHLNPAYFRDDAPCTAKHTAPS
jgi:hypothetical protein